MEKLCLEFKQGCLNTVSWKSQQSFRKSQVLQRCAHGQTECHGQKGLSAICFVSVSNHFPKKFHFYGKFIFPCFTSNKITWELARKDWKVGRGKEESENVSMCLLHLCIPGWGWTGLFSVCFVFFFLIVLKNAALKPHF